MGKKGKKGGGKKGGKGKKKDKKPKLSRDDELNAAVTNAVLWKQKLELTERQVNSQIFSYQILDHLFGSSYQPLT